MILIVKVKPGSKTDSIKIGENIVVQIKQKPVEGKANKYLIEFLADVFGITNSRISIENGNTSQFKRLSIDLDEQSVLRILDKYKQSSIR
jgi:uncharacterized protein (TIGR00251 family)